MLNPITREDKDYLLNTESLTDDQRFAYLGKIAVAVKKEDSKTLTAIKAELDKLQGKQVITEDEAQEYGKTLRDDKILCQILNTRNLTGAFKRGLGIK